MSWYRASRTVVVVDVVESVRLMLEFEDETIRAWREFVDDCRRNLLGRFRGKLVKSLGDGMLLSFDATLDAVNAALELQRRMQSFNVNRVADRALHLRIGVHATEMVVDELDIYGSGINLAARLATLAGPDEVILSPEARDALVPGLDVEIEDLGECYLKHFTEPQRAYRAGPVGEKSVMWASNAAGATDRVVVAVIPFAPIGVADDKQLLGEVVADDLIAQLSQLQQLQVVSRLSTTALRARELDLGLLTSMLACHYVVHGSCSVQGERFRLRAQLVDCLSGEVIWADGFDGVVFDALGSTSTVVDQLTASICRALLDAEIGRALSRPLPSLQSYTILLGAIASMHRLAPREFERARQMLDYLVERHPRSTAPRAWLGKWHVMRVAQGWSVDPDSDAQAAHSVVSRALDNDPSNGLALAIDGLICAYINKDLRTAEQRYDAAIEANPSEGLAWLFRSALHSYHDRGDAAVKCAERARRLSPLDPMMYYYDHFYSMARLAAGDHSGAVEYGLKSMRANRAHGPNLRILAIAQALSGQMEDAHRTVQELLRVEPGFTASRFLERYPGSAAGHARRYAHILQAAGLPA